jgi:signal transduction histidine kinase/CheY-like chemotaxis protein
MVAAPGSMSDPPQPEAEGAGETARLRRRVARERRAREEAEALLMSKSRELYDANRRLAELAESLEQQVDFKGKELLNAQRLARFGTLVWEIRAERITWSEGVYHVLGLDPEGEPLSFDRYVSLIHPEDRDGFVSHIRQNVEEVLELNREYHVEHRVITPGGEVRWVHGYAEAISRGAGELEYVIGAVRDVTADKTTAIEAEESRRIIESRVRELEQTRDALAEARDQAQAASLTKSRFLAMMSHEIRTPLNGILGTLHMLEDTALAAQQVRLVGAALVSGENLRTILGDILDLSKMEAGRMELEESPFAFVESVEEGCRFWRPLAEQKGLAFHVVVDPDVPTKVEGDATRIRQILNNLVSNAIKFTAEGEVRVRLGLDPEKPDAGGRSNVLLEVHDSGDGIARDQQGQLFREFSQLGDPGLGGESGTGLGLAISRQLAELMDGAVGVTSAVGVGSCFWLRLPLRVVEGDLKRQDARKQPPLSDLLGRRPRVLLAEDVPTNQMIAEHLVSGFDCAVEVAANGLEVLDALAERPFDIVLMDVSMPEMDGLEATRRLRALDGAVASIPVIGVTAYAMSEDTARFVEAGMDDCVSKPLSRKALYRAMAASLAHVAAAGPVPSAAIEEDVVDPAVLQQLAQHLTAEQVDDLLGKLDADLRDSRARAAEALEARDADGLARAAHAVKGLAASLGAVPLADAARRVESAARAGDLDDAEQAQRTLSRLLAATLDHFTSIRDGAPEP